MTLVRCEACDGEVSAEARTCIHCGQPLKARNHRLWIAIALCIAAAITLYLKRDFIYGFIAELEWAQEGHPGLPSCDSRIAQTDARRAFENSPLAKTFGITIVNFANPLTLSASKSRVECKATVILNSSATGYIDYNFRTDSSLPRGKYLVLAALEMDNFKAVATTSAPQQPAVVITASQLVGAYQANQVAADAKYKGQTIQVSGKIDGIGKDILDDPYVSLTGDPTNPLADVQCQFSQNDEAALASLSKGQQVTLQGTGKGMTIETVEIRNCSIVAQ